MARQDVLGGNGLGKVTATAGTKIRRLLPNMVGMFTRLGKLVYTPGANSHLLTAMRPIGQTTLTADAAAGQAVVNVAVDPGAAASNPIAANDLVAIAELDGVTRFYVVSSVAALAITLTANLVAGAKNGASFWDYGIESDTDPRIGAAHPTWDLLTGGATTLSDDTGGVVASHLRNTPVLLSIDNVTAAGILNQTSWFHTSG
jgi:hypothetical protein